MTLMHARTDSFRQRPYKSSEWELPYSKAKLVKKRQDVVAVVVAVASSSGKGKSRIF